MYNTQYTVYIYGIGSQLWRLRSPGPGEPMVKFQSKSEGGGDQCSSWKTVRPRARILSYSAFCSVEPFSDWVRPTHPGEGQQPAYSLCQFKC